jgi:isopropylmalate/homocitrate/citramalate synthase
MKNDKQLWWLSELNQKPEVLGKHHFPKKLKIYDTTLRDGEQTIGVSFDKGEKLEIAKMLDEMGVDRIEAGMPVVSKEDREAVELILKAGLKAEIWGFCRAVKGDIEACADVGAKHVIVEIATSPIKMKANNFTPEGVLGKIVDSLQYAKSRGLYTAFFAVDATRADLRYLETVYRKAIEEGKADEVVMVDTLGVATPETMFYLTKKLRE